jgi:hypothetical protein
MVRADPRGQIRFHVRERARRGGGMVRSGLFRQGGFLLLDHRG